MVEFDGGYHQEKLQAWQAKDRIANLEALSLQVIRFTNEEVLFKLEKVFAIIKEKLQG